MRSLLLGLLSAAVAVSVFAPSAAAADKRIEWERYEGDTVQLDVPKGWTVEVSDGGGVLVEDRSSATKSSR